MASVNPAFWLGLGGGFTDKDRGHIAQMVLSPANNRLFRIFFAIIFLFLTLSAKAAIQFDVFAGYDSTVRQAHWYPVTFEIKNDGPTFSGFVEVGSTQMGRQQTRRVPVELPTGTLKRITLPVFSSSRNDSWTAALLSERIRGRVIERRDFGPQNLNQKVFNAIVVGSVARTASGLPVFPQIKRTGLKEYQPTAARILPSLFPDNPVALDGLQAIYLSSERALELKVPQAQALLAWLQDGGHLIVGVEQIADVNATPWLRELLPCQFSSVTKVKTSTAFSQWLRQGDEDTENAEPQKISPLRMNKRDKPLYSVRVSDLWTAAGTNIVADGAFDSGEIDVAVGTAGDRGRVLASADGVPLAFASRHGRGTITTLAFSPERQPFLVLGDVG